MGRLQEKRKAGSKPDEKVEDIGSQSLCSAENYEIYPVVEE